MGARIHRGKKKTTTTRVSFYWTKVRWGVKSDPTRSPAGLIAVKSYRQIHGVRVKRDFFEPSVLITTEVSDTQIFDTKAQLHAVV